MADSTLAPTPRSMSPAGLAGLLGLFAGFCAIFSVCATLMDWRNEASEARWPQVSAMIERADVIASEHGDGRATSWNLRAHVRYEVNGVARTATLTSRTAFSDINAEQLQSWAEEFRTGRRVDIRYDPSRVTRVVFAEAELSSVAGRVRTDLMFVGVAAVACVLLLALARALAAREARAAPRADGNQRGQPLLGVAVAAMGLMIAGSGILGAVHTEPFNADGLMAVPAGLMFVFAGGLVGLPPDSKRRDLLAKLLVTCFALTFDWVAFGPGERQFTGSLGLVSNEWVGRTLFGAFAVLLDVLAIAMWTGRLKGQAISPSNSTT